MADSFSFVSYVVMSTHADESNYFAALGILEDGD